MKESFGYLPTGEECSLYTISCGGLTASVTDLGASLVRLLVPDSQGNLADVVLGYDSCDGYLHCSGYIGATVGRCANRIKGSSFVLGRKTYFLTPNEGRNNLHSGPDPYSTRLWKVIQHSDDAITLELRSPNGDQGFPGNAMIQLTYRLDSSGGLHLLYDAVSDQDTVFNLTNHSYFNLSGHSRTDRAMEQLLSLPGRFFTPADAESIPTGEKRSVEGTPMDFRVPKPIGRDIGADYEPLHLQSGYDHNWAVNGTAGTLRPAARAYCEETGIMLEALTMQPGVKFYSGNYLDGCPAGKGGAPYDIRWGFCLETQGYPDSPNKPQFPSTVLKQGETYHQTTVYQFSVK